LQLSVKYRFETVSIFIFNMLLMSTKKEKVSILNLKKWFSYYKWKVKCNQQFRTTKTRHKNPPSSHITMLLGQLMFRNLTFRNRVDVSKLNEQFTVGRWLPDRPIWQVKQRWALRFDSPIKCWKIKCWKIKNFLSDLLNSTS
jgi:hypothetical protein